MVILVDITKKRENFISRLVPPTGVAPARPPGQGFLRPQRLLFRHEGFVSSYLPFRHEAIIHKY